MLPCRIEVARGRRSPTHLRHPREVPIMPEPGMEKLLKKAREMKE